MKSKLETTTTETPFILNEVMVKKLGAAFVPGRDVKHIAKDVRAIIKKAVKAGYLPQMKASVRIERFAGGTAIDVEITECSKTVINVDAWRTQAANNWNLSWSDVGCRYNTAGNEILSFLNQVLSAFQKSETHEQSDYHTTNFYADVKFDCDMLQGQFSSLSEC